MEKEMEQFLGKDEMKAQIRQWKEEYGNVYLTEIDDVCFIWRGISRGEYRKAIKIYDDALERAEYVCEICVLSPAHIDYTNEIYAGIPETLAENILVQSGFGPDDSLIKQLSKQYDKEMEQFDNQITCVIAEVFPYFTIDEIDNWQMEKTLWYFARAKWILKILRNVELTEDENSEIPGLPSDFPVAPNAQ